MIAAVVERCAGIDVGKRFLKVCILLGPLSEEPRHEIRRVDCKRRDLEAMQAWLIAEGVTQVVMESTGPYWVPIYNLLESHMKVLLANPADVKHRRGHKTDASDAHWMAHLLRHGLIRASFIPERNTRDLREVTRRRKKLLSQAAQERNRVQKQLEYGNVKLGNELSDVFGVSGQRMLKALVDEQRTPEQIANLAQGSLKQKKEAIADSVAGSCLSETQKEMIRSSMRHLVFLELEVAELDKQAAALVQSSGQQEAWELLQTIPGIKREAAANLLAETGSDMSQFPDASHLSSWGGVCPGNNESAGKHKSRHTTKGNPWFRQTLIECAWAASRTKGSAFQARYNGLKKHSEHKLALVAVAHDLAKAIYYVLSRREVYRAPEPNQTTEVQRQRLIRHHTRRLRRLGCWLPVERLTPLQEWYASHCLPDPGPEEPKRRGPKPKVKIEVEQAGAGSELPAKRRGRPRKQPEEQASTAKAKLPARPKRNAGTQAAEERG